MRRSLIAAALALFLFEAVGSIQAEQPVYIGATGSGGSGPGIYRAMLDEETGQLGQPEKLAAIDGAGFFDFAPNGESLVSLSRPPRGSGREGRIVAFSVDGEGRLKQLNDLGTGGLGPCYVEVSPDGRHALVAHYTGGSVFVASINEDGSLNRRTDFVQHEGASVHPNRQTSPHAHCFRLDPSGKVGVVPDLGADRCFIYRLDSETGELTPADPPSVPATEPGSGPRHNFFRPDGKFMYLVNEMTSKVTVYRFDADEASLEEIQTLSTLPSDYSGGNSCSEVRVHPSGRFVFAANRGHNSIASFAIDEAEGTLTFIEAESTGGEIPRHFNVTPDGEFVIVANQRSNTVTVLPIDTETGELAPMSSEISAPNPMCIQFPPE